MIRLVIPEPTDHSNITNKKDFMYLLMWCSTSTETLLEVSLQKKKKEKIEPESIQLQDPTIILQEKCVMC